MIRTVNALCAELRPDAGLLVEAFGVPEMTARARRGYAMSSVRSSWESSGSRNS